MGENLIYVVRALNGNEPKLYSARIIRESKKQIQVTFVPRSEDAYAFNFKTRYAVAEVCRTPEGAWRTFYEVIDIEVSGLSDKLQRSADLLAYAATVIQTEAWA